MGGAQISKPTVGGTSKSKSAEVPLTVVNSNLNYGFTSTVRKMKMLAEATSLLGRSVLSLTLLAKLSNQEKRFKHRKDSFGDL